MRFRLINKKKQSSHVCGSIMGHKVKINVGRINVDNLSLVVFYSFIISPRASTSYPLTSRVGQPVTRSLNFA